MSDTSLGRQTSDVAAAKMIAMAAKDQPPPTVSATWQRLCNTRNGPAR
ncbi:hypothetical protein [Streptomyces olivochromogenes]|uniref:Uncharacterized protein n=1 Tax=Streptomyces olivochromogenes TaxID=1963 RepID=A0A250VU74_STROL|nr:hypothetical protein [Streptomyces olivochromogenes]GAX57582.1 hypothetical protein SO3561_09152 [Streptomyces olivochromogenes]